MQRDSAGRIIIRRKRKIEYLHQVAIPGIAADMEVVVAKLLLGGLSKDVSW